MRKLIALSKFPFDRRDIKAGDAFEAEERDALVLTTAGLARYETRDLQPALKLSRAGRQNPPLITKAA